MHAPCPRASIVTAVWGELHCAKKWGSRLREAPVGLGRPTAASTKWDFRLRGASLGLTWPVSGARRPSLIFRTWFGRRLASHLPNSGSKIKATMCGAVSQKTREHEQKAAWQLWLQALHPRPSPPPYNTTARARHDEPWSRGAADSWAAPPFI